MGEGGAEGGGGSRFEGWGVGGEEISEDVRDISDVTVNVQSALWNFERCQVGSAGARAVMLRPYEGCIKALCRLY
jgi:hypothetical protein